MGNQARARRSALDRGTTLDALASAAPSTPCDLSRPPAIRHRSLEQRALEYAGSGATCHPATRALERQLERLERQRQRIRLERNRLAANWVRNRAISIAGRRLSVERRAAGLPEGEAGRPAGAGIGGTPGSAPAAAGGTIDRP